MSNDNCEIKVNGLKCNSCVLAVENSLKELDGVDDAKADLETGIVKLDYDKDKVSNGDIEESVEDAGFSMEK
ncbi:MAG: cation transporter [Methanobacteriaceae archaeon]|jgi:copper ion binding protein|nr:cation transporter [Methanobacteriaceae archaeon]